MKGTAFLTFTTGFAVMALALITGCGGGGGPSGKAETGAVKAATVTVDMTDNKFVPDNITVNPGDTVVWTNREASVHTSTSGTPGTPDNKWDSGELNEGETFKRVFDEAGAYPYYCNQHYSTGMTGMVTVREKSGGI